MGQYYKAYVVDAEVMEHKGGDNERGTLLLHNQIRGQGMLLA